MSRRYWLQLALTEGIGPILTQRLIETAGGVQQACEASVSLLRQIDGIGSARAEQIHGALEQAGAEVDRELDRAKAAGIDLICRDDPQYPALLKSIPDPPTVLYVKGALEPRDLNALAIVGSRRCSFYGREQSERFAALLAGAGFTVVSGGARGVDSAAHRGALSHPQGRTIAVLGCGIDSAYPPENQPLFDQIIQRGAIVGEYPIGTPPLAENFPRRNRLISGLSRGVLVIEGDSRSGALITARQACEDHGRAVFALPGRVDNKMSAGPHKLIRDGAVLVTCLDDVLEALDPLPKDAFEIPPFADEQQEQQSEPEPAISLDESQELILAQLEDDCLAADAIIERTALPAATVMRQLTLMSLKGLIQRVDGQTYARRKQRK